MSEVVQHLKFSPVTVIKPRNSFINLPVFSDAVTWEGASELKRQYNFTATERVLLTAMLEKPAGVDYLLCVKYTVGTEDQNVTRFRAWEGVGEGAAMAQYPLYTNQTLPKKFSLEIWNTENQTTISNAAVKVIETSPTHDPIKASENVITELVVGAAHTDYTLQSVAPVRATTQYALYNNDDLSIVSSVYFPENVNQWLDATAGNRDLTVKGGQPTNQFAQEDVFRGQQAVEFDSAQLASPVNTYDYVAMWLTFRASSWTDGESIIENGSFKVKMVESGSDNDISVGSVSLGIDLPLNSNIVLYLIVGASSVIYQYYGEEEANGVVSGSPVVGSSSTFQIGKTSNTGAFTVADVALFETVAIADLARDLEKAYLIDRYVGAFDLGASFHADVAFVNTIF